MICPVGELDAANADSWRAQLGMVSCGARSIIDLGAVSFMDSTCIGVLAHAARSAREHGGQLVLAGAQGAVAELLELLRLPQVIPMFADIEQAMACLEAQA